MKSRGIATCPLTAPARSPRRHPAAQPRIGIRPRNNPVGRGQRPPACYIPPMSDPFELTGPASGASASQDARAGADVAHLEGLNDTQPRSQAGRQSPDDPEKDRPLGCPDLGKPISALLLV